MILIQRKLLFLFLVITFLSSCGSDVDPGIIEGSPRSSEAIYEQDLKFFKTKDKHINGDEDQLNRVFINLIKND